VGHGGGSDSALLLAAATFGRTAVEHLEEFEFTVKAAVAFIYAPSRFFLKENTGAEKSSSGVHLKSEMR
jgi:hypothetical protein